MFCGQLPERFRSPFLYDQIEKYRSSILKSATLLVVTLISLLVRCSDNIFAMIDTLSFVVDFYRSWHNYSSNRRFVQVFSEKVAAQSLRGGKQRDRGWHGGMLHANSAAIIFPACSRRTSGALMKTHTAWRNRTRKLESKLIALRTFSCRFCKERFTLR